MAVAGGPNIVEDGLFISVDAANIKSYPGSGTVITDLISKTDGTLVNGTVFSATQGGILEFDGTNDHITVEYGSSSDFADEQFTLRAIFKWSGGGGGSDGRNYLIQNDDGGGSVFPLSLEINTRDYDPPRFASWDHTSDTGNHRNSTKEVEQDMWYDFVVTYERAGSHVIYVDGVAISTWDAPDSLLRPFSNGFNIGTYRGRNNRWFNGSIGLAQIYNRALTAQEVEQNYNATKGRFGL